MSHRLKRSPTNQKAFLIFQLEDWSIPSMATGCGLVNSVTYLVVILFPEVNVKGNKVNKHNLAESSVINRFSQGE